MTLEIAGQVTYNDSMMRNLNEKTWFCLTCGSEVGFGHNEQHNVQWVQLREIAWQNRLDRLFDRVDMSEQVHFFDEE